MEHAPDPSAARTSAEAVFRNAEQQVQIEKAAAWLQIEAPDIESIPVLSPDEDGLQLVLVPIPPVNPWLLQEAAKVYEQITEVPVKIRRMPDEWNWTTPERIPHQLQVESILLGLHGNEMDFTGWSKDRYIEELSFPIIVCSGKLWPNLLTPVSVWWSESPKNWFRQA